MRKKIIILIFILVLLFVGSTYALGEGKWFEWAKTFDSNRSGDDVILAEVNGIYIYQSTIERCKLQYSINGNNSKDSYTDRDWIQDQIKIEIMVMEASRLEIEVSDERISEAVKSGKEIYFNHSNEEASKDFIEQIDFFCFEKNISPEEYFEIYAFDVYSKNYNFMATLSYIDTKIEEDYDIDAKINQYIDEVIEKGIYEVKYFD